MTPAHTDSPLRRSEAGIFREPGAQGPLHNDDDQERQAARRRTLFNSSDGTTTDASTLEQSEKLKKSLALFHENKISKENAWSESVIDTVSSLLERHHKSLNNFMFAGSSLEMSTKVYGFRVDSVHTDVLRMSAGLNARKFRENQDDDDGVATGGEGNADPNSSANTGEEPPRAAQKKKKQRKKAGATVTKNKETLNARLDTVPLQDPVFGKLNTIVGSINASNRLMNNMLNTVESELRLRTTHKFWFANDTLEECDFTEPVQLNDILDLKLLPCDGLSRVESFEGLLLRPTNSGYVILDTPIAPGDDDQVMPPLDDDNRNAESSPIGHDGGLFDNCGDTSMAFDINAVCEPLPQLDAYEPILAVDGQDYNEYTAEEHDAIGHCRGLRKAAVVIEDMRPIDSTTSLEYSYRPMEKISQFWAGPSHWRFRRTRHRSTMGPNAGNNQQTDADGRRLNHQRRVRNNALQSKKRLRVEFAEPIHDNLFTKLDSKYKSRRANFQKKWDQKKMRLPLDLQLDANLVNCRCFAPAFCIADDTSHTISEDFGSENTAPTPLEDEHFAAADGNDDAVAGGDADLFDALHDSLLAGSAMPPDGDTGHLNLTLTGEQENQVIEQNPANDTVLEIATDFENAPRQVTKIVVPFAKRAKVIDMKNLKRTCTHLITRQFQENAATNESQIPLHPIEKNEHYASGLASFKKLYETLPNMLPPVMAEGLSTSIALYSVLHLANDYNYRLIPQDDIEDFSIRQVLDD